MEHGKKAIEKNPALLRPAFLFLFQDQNRNDTVPSDKDCDTLSSAPPQTPAP